MKTIDLSEYTGNGKVRSLFGKDRGLDARKRYNIDELDSSPDVVRVIIPEYVYAVSTSFFCGMFGDSYISLGEEKLLTKYVFQAPDHIWVQIEQGLARCTIEFQPFVSSSAG